MIRPEKSVPQFWSQEISTEGGTLLTYAVRGGKSQAVLVMLGLVLLLGGLWVVQWLLGSDGELTIPGYVFLLVPAGVSIFGGYCLDIAFFARTRYLLGTQRFSARRVSIFQSSQTDIPRQSVVEIMQQYSPPKSSASTGNHGDWSTFLVYRDGKHSGEFPLDGMHTQEEAKWLAALLSQWAGVPVKRGFGPAFVEADPEELPSCGKEEQASEDRTVI